MKKEIITITAIIFSLILGGTLYFFNDYLRPPYGAELIKVEPIKDELLLKAPVEKILKSREVDWIEKKEDGTIEDKGKIKEYDYITDRKATGKYKWDDDNYTNLEIMPDGVYKLWIGDHFYKNKVTKEVFEIEHSATTSIEAFDEQTKVSWLKKLTGQDVYAEETAYTQAGDGNVNNDARTGWDAVHDAGTGTTVYQTEDWIMSFSWASDAGRWIITRGFFPGDGSGLPVGCVVASTTFYAYVSEKDNGDNDGDDWMNVVGQTSQANPAALATADFDACGSVDNPTEGATRIDLADITAGGFNAWRLNATGMGWIDSNILIGMREGHDAIDSPIANPGALTRNGFKVRYSAYAGSTSDPYFTIECEEAVVEEEKKQDIINYQ